MLHLDDDPPSKLPGIGGYMSEQVHFTRAEPATCVMCESPYPTNLRLRDVEGQPPCHMTCAAKLLIVIGVNKTGVLTETHLRWLAAWRAQGLHRLPGG